MVNDWRNLKASFEQSFKNNDSKVDKSGTTTLNGGA